jgi:hypothetical protein
MPMPPNTPRPEMWTPESIIQAVNDGFTFLIPFHYDGFDSGNAYYIMGRQYSAFGLTVGPHHTPDMSMTPEGWVEIVMHFRRGMVPDDAFTGKLDERDVGPVVGSIDPSTIDWEQLNGGHQILVSGLRRNPTTEPEVAAPKIVKNLEKKLGLRGLEIIYQADYLDQGREHCSRSPFTILSNGGGMISASLTDSTVDYASKFGYWAEPWDDYELCYIPTDDNRERYYGKKADDYQKNRSADAETQKSYKKAKAILKRLPEVDWPEGIHHFAHIRMKNFFEVKGRLTREAMVGSGPNKASDLEKAFEKIRKLKGVANVWYNID